MLSEADFIGVWRLISNLDVDEDGITSEGPLGPDPKGLLIYDAHGYMSVSMMARTGSVLSSDNHFSGTGSGLRKPSMTYMGYSGTWRLLEDVVVHEVEVGSHLYMVNTKQIRKAVLGDDRLTLYATALIAGRPQRRILSWQRA